MKKYSSRPVILIVDDDKSTRYLMQECLCDLGDIVMLDSAEAALDYITAGLPADLMILDIVMAGMNGIELLKQIRSHEKEIFLPCLIYTAYNDPDMERLAFDAGATDFIEKPISFARLQLRVRAHLKSKQLYDQVLQAASVDHLCGVLNRQTFLSNLLEELKRATRVPYHIALMMVDLDQFKSLNDNLGHAAGDQALMKVSETLSTCFARTGESVGRYAGDEFLVTSFGLDPDALVRSAEVMRNAVAAIEVQVNGQSVNISCSVGMIIVDFSRCQILRDQGKSLLHWMLHQADRLMYEAKRSGRNKLHHCVHVYTGEESINKEAE